MVSGEGLRGRRRFTPQRPDLRGITETEPTPDGLDVRIDLGPGMEEQMGHSGSSDGMEPDSQHVTIRTTHHSCRLSSSRNRSVVKGPDTLFVFILVPPNDSYEIRPLSLDPRKT